MWCVIKFTLLFILIFILAPVLAYVVCKLAAMGWNRGLNKPRRKEG